MAKTIDNKHDGNESHVFLSQFKLERVLSHDHFSKSCSLLGTFTPTKAIPSSFSINSSSLGIAQRAILRLEKTSFLLPSSLENESPSGQEEKTTAVVANLGKTFEMMRVKGQNDVYCWLMGWIGSGSEVRSGGENETEGVREPDIKIEMICPCTDVHIAKYTSQPFRMVRETPELYRSAVLPYIESFPPSRIKWLYQVLDHEAESELIIYEDSDPQNGFLVLPDSKWDRTTIETLYLQAIPHTRSIRSIRDLRPQHLPMLKKMKREGERAVIEKYGLEKGMVRMLVHYQPSYYHFHIHIIYVSYSGFAGATTGQSHLLDDIIDNLEMEASFREQDPRWKSLSEEEKKVEEENNSYYAKRTFTYGLGIRHGLWEKLDNAMGE